MNKKDLTELTIDLYRLTLLFPKKEPLRYKIRELADELLANFIRFRENNSFNQFSENGSRKIEDDLEVLDSFLEVAKNQNWVSRAEILKLQEKFPKIKEDLTCHKEGAVLRQPLGGRTVVGKASPPLGEGIKRGKNLRYQKILELLKEKGEVQVWELKKIFTEVSKRTLRRDFEQLVRQGLIERKGERNTTFYRLKVGQCEG